MAIFDRRHLSLDPSLVLLVARLVPDSNFVSVVVPESKWQALIRAWRAPSQAMRVRVRMARRAVH